MNNYNCEIIADSISPQGNRLTTYLLNVPQIIVKELLRHRMFSFSSSSMRAMPFNKVLRNTKENMFIPLAFQSHHSGMQGSEYLTGDDAKQAKVQWIKAGLKACEEADRLYKIGVTKQLCSRIIEPYGYVKILVTATEYDNFFELRCPKYKTSEGIFRSRKDALMTKYGDAYSQKNLESTYTDNLLNLEWLKCSESGAEIHIQALAEAMWDARNESKPKKLKAGEWHVPFGYKIDLDSNQWLDLCDKYYPGVDDWDKVEPLLIKIATARCARLSYMTFDGEIDYEKDIKLHDTLLESGHMSPFEHCARVMSDDEYVLFIKGNLKEYTWNSMLEEGDNVTCLDTEVDLKDPNQGWCNNFRGFIPYRYIIENGNN